MKFEIKFTIETEDENLPLKEFKKIANGSIMSLRI